jgi:hypothetical protein
LVKKDGEYAFGQSVADDEVDLGRAEISAETGGVLAERAPRIRRLGFGSEDAHENDVATFARRARTVKQDVRGLKRIYRASSDQELHGRWACGDPTAGASSQVTGNLSGPATKRILEREYVKYGRTVYQRLAGIAVPQIYQFRNSAA